jgi:hemoglobin/transferrin/lactoferrin receptor protein
VIQHFLAGVIFLLPVLRTDNGVRLLDQSSKQPIEGAVVYNAAQTVFTESTADGWVNLSLFQIEDKLTVQHPAYHSLSFTIKELEKQEVILLTEKVVKIDEVVISANKWEQKRSEIPFEILSLTVDDMRSSGSQTAADVLESTGQVFVQKSQLGGGSPMIRGFGANAVLIVVDGIRMNNTIFRGGNLQNIISIDPNALQGSEVVFGPGAVIYGSDALGGVMDFHTIKPRYSHEKPAINGRAMLRFSSANREGTGSFQAWAGGKRLAYAGSISCSDFSDLRTGAVRPKAHPDFGKRPEYVERINGADSIRVNDNENMQRFSAYRQFSTLQKMALRLSDHGQLTYTFIFSATGDIPRYDRLTIYDDDGQLVYASWYYGPQKWMMNALKLERFKKGKLFDGMKLSLAYQQFEESRHDRRYRAADLRKRFEKVGVFSLNADFEKLINANNHLYYGLEGLFNHVKSTAYSQNIETGETGALSTRYPSGGSDVSGGALYVSYKRDICEKLFFNTGIRYTYQHLFSRFNHPSFDFRSIQNTSSALNGNAGLVWKPGRQWVLSAIFSSGFRAPNVDDISKVFDSEPGSVLVPNPGLKPEYSYNGSLSFSKRFAEKVFVNGTVFYSRLRDAMVRDDFTVGGRDSIVYDGTLSRVQAIVNTGKANIFGFTFGTTVELGRYWSASAHINVTEGKDLVQEEPLRHTTPVFGLGSIQYQTKELEATFSLRFNGARGLDDLPPSERNKTHIYSSDGSLAWFTLNMRAQYRLSEWLGVNAALENILDHHYRTYSSGISAPGRNFVISLNASF